MPGKKNTAWLEKLAKWQGKIDEVVKELNKNQDELEARMVSLWKVHASCREQMLTDIAKLKSGAQYRQNRWANIDKIIIAVASAIVTAIIIKLWPA